MKVEVRFDILDEFDIPLGDMQGALELPSAPAKGDSIELAAHASSLIRLGCPQTMTVSGVDTPEQSGSHEWVAWLEALYVDNAETGKPLIRALERELGFALMAYRDRGLE